MSHDPNRPCSKCGATPRRRNSCFCDECYREYFRNKQRERRTKTAAAKKTFAALVTEAAECRDLIARMKAGEL